MAASVAPEGPSESLFAKFSKPFSTAITAAYKRLLGPYTSHIRCGRTPFDMPGHLIAPLCGSVTACSTGPYGGICQLEPDKDAPTHPPGIIDESIAGVVGWQRPQSNADGESITLYEHKDQSTYHHGDPIADVFAILARPNSCILAVADGCGWGIKPRLAARCAVHGSIEHLNEKLFSSSSAEKFTTQDVFHVMYRSLHTAQKRIIQHGGTTTTLCLAVVVELAEAKAGNRWGCLRCECRRLRLLRLAARVSGGSRGDSSH
ncbi:PP2C-like domain-containing protein CG9801 [Geodia barretti]|uniref:PP2C-like domain-containing protein CG9801 n=1 Tax=Geodia barretti TaxID=519541 RepID=A0AA35SS53_GEOBA|nr:PP2C-like domain-containing protein CG9801 [Geodia barretti]